MQSNQSTMDQRIQQLLTLASTAMGRQSPTTKNAEVQAGPSQSPAYQPIKVSILDLNPKEKMRRKASKKSRSPLGVQHAKKIDSSRQSLATSTALSVQRRMSLVPTDGGFRLEVGGPLDKITSGEVSVEQTGATLEASNDYELNFKKKKKKK